MHKIVTLEGHLRHFENAIIIIASSNHINQRTIIGIIVAEITLYIINIFINAIRECRGTQIANEN
jgi:hypothetical protein